MVKPSAAAAKPNGVSASAASQTTDSTSNQSQISQQTCAAPTDIDPLSSAALRQSGDYINGLDDTVENREVVNGVEVCSASKISHVNGHVSTHETNGLFSDDEASTSPNFCAPISEDELFIDDGKGNVDATLPYYYFAVFDGHAGWGAAAYASKHLHEFIDTNLTKVAKHILVDSDEVNYNLPVWQQQPKTDVSSVVVGALEQAFYLMDNKIEQDRYRLNISGGCTACVALLILGKLYVANAGDSRATVCLHEAAHPMSYDFTPETENYRIRKFGGQHSELLSGLYNPIEFLQRPLQREIGTESLCRYPYMARGWVYKKVTEDDMKCPLVCGSGKRSRVMGTIGVTRGFGDHDLKSQSTNVLIKPFLSCEPEVRIFDLADEELSDSDVLMLATDGLWDIASNENAVATLVRSMARSLQHLPSSDPSRHKYRYTSAAQDLVMSARGKLTQRNWRTNDNKHATIDDISVFVVPLKPYQDEYKHWKRRYEEALAAPTPISSESSVHDSGKLLTVKDGILVSETTKLTNGNETASLLSATTVDDSSGAVFSNSIDGGTIPLRRSFTDLAVGASGDDTSSLFHVQQSDSETNSSALSLDTPTEDHFEVDKAILSLDR